MQVASDELAGSFDRGLPNRVLFNDRLEHGLEQAKRYDRTLAVMFVDLDDFKKINDSYGHNLGDCVLQTIAGRLKENMRSDDIVSRHGGDEFLYLLVEVRDEQDLTMIAKKIIKVIQVPCDILAHNLIIHPSIGISIFPKDGTTADALVKSADKAMYRTKRNKSGYSFAQQCSASVGAVTTTPGFNAGVEADVDSEADSAACQGATNGDDHCSGNQSLAQRQRRLIRRRLHCIWPLLPPRMIC